MKRKPLLLAAAAAVVLAGGIALAQSVDGIDVTAIGEKAEADAVDEQAFVDDILARAEAVKGEGQEFVGEVEASMPERIGSLKVGSDGLVDFDEVLADAAALQETGDEAPRLIVFASLSMPEDSLKALIRDTGRAGGAVVFRGFPGNSMRAFQEGVMKVVENNDDYGNIGIDPRLFRAFDVRTVPTFVATSANFDPCDGFDCTTQLPPYDRMSGNVTLGYVLETFADGKGPGAQVSRVAKARLDKRGS